MRYTGAYFITPREADELLQSLDECCWSVEDMDHGVWKAGCGDKHQFMVGGPKDNKYRYCPYCGKTLVEVGR